MVNASSTAIIATATNVAEPRSSLARLDSSDRVGADRDARQKDRMRGDGRDRQPAFLSQLKLRAARSDALRCLQRGPVIAARRKTCRLTRGIDTPNLHRQRCETGRAPHQNDDQRGDRERSLNSGRAAIVGQTLVFSARLMMLVSAVTMESPVTTV